jgi:hypothetical protein
MVTFQIEYIFIIIKLNKNYFRKWCYGVNRVHDSSYEFDILVQISQVDQRYHFFNTWKTLLHMIESNYDFFNTS